MPSQVPGQAICGAMLVAFLSASVFAESLDTQTNLVPDGTISVVPGDADRDDWDGVPWYDFDDDFLPAYPVDIDRAQFAHDSSNIYMRFETLEWDVEEAWRVGAYIDVDQDITTGYTGNFLPLGADYFVEGASAFMFNAATQADWGWTEVKLLERDQTSMLDVEVEIPRLEIDNPIAFDFILFANNWFEFEMDDDIYPNEPGGVFTYELGDQVVAVPGDCSGDGIIDAADLACVTTVDGRDLVLTTLGTLAGDLNGDGQVAFPDFLILSANFGADLPAYTDGNIDLADGVGFPDFLVLSANFGNSGVAAAVPEPGTWSSCLLCAVAFTTCGRRRRRHEQP